ncbi:MAG: retroviral-like aspartic protease family protein [Alphaproteobacteria bacterium]|nr:retroviral-like aspartic protease family protein [Alphaproteobacteria bacterium]
MSIPFDVRQRQLFLDVLLCEPNGEGVENYTSYKGLIDTGATNSCISARVVNDLQLSIVGFQELHGVAGLTKAPYYFVNLSVPFGATEFVTPTFRVNGFSAQDHFDVLLGMDVLSKGHLSIDGFAGRFTFCL